MPLNNGTIYEPVPSLTFITNPPTFDYVHGRVYFDGTDTTLSVSQDDDVTLQVGQEYVK